MLVSELIQILQQLPQDETVTLFTTEYRGGGDDDTYSQPIVCQMANDEVYITPVHSVDALEHYVNDIKQRFS